MAANHLIKATTSFLLLSTTTNTPRFLPFSLLKPQTPNPISPFLSLSSPSKHHFQFPSFCTSSNAPSTSTSTTIVNDDTLSSSSSSSSMEVSEIVDVKAVANMLDIRVGKVLKAWVHPDASSLYVEEVDIGEDEPRTICSGLVPYLPIDHLQDKKVVVLANLKAKNMRGIKSNGMLLAASDEKHENVELLVPPEDSVPGERIWFGLEEEKEIQPAAATANQIQKKKIWQSVQPHLKTDDACIAMLDGNYMRTSAGPVVSSSLKNANIA